MLAIYSKPNDRIYGIFFNCRYLFGMYAFGLEETNFYQEAEKQARKVIHGDNWEKPFRSC